jgi:CRISPR-associated protein Cmr2
MSPFFGVTAETAAGFLDSPAWEVLRPGINWDDNTTFFAPNPGVLYPAIYELAERTLAAAKSARTFDQQSQEGWRCSLTGEAEWLTTDRDQLKESYRQRTDTLWAKIAKKKPAWAKKGEHLSALPAIKRLWPTVFAEEAGRGVAARDDGEANRLDRFVVSTHTMALARHLDAWLEKGGLTAAGLRERLNEPGVESVALPRKVMLRHRVNPDAIGDAKRLPGLLEKADEENDETGRGETERLVRKTFGVDRLETYYALIMMDGDHMGKMLSGEDEESGIAFRESFHPRTKMWFDKVAAMQPRIGKYGQQKRPVSPNRHLAISGALNDFSQTVVRHVVEYEHLGRVLYAGGDDVLAMLPVTDLLSAMQRLRQAYGGDSPRDAAIDRGHTGERNSLLCKNGFAWLNGRLMRMLGEKATASCGAVIAHHQTPLGAVMRELRAAERRAKGEGKRNAFSITVIKRSGGALYLTDKWGEALDTLNALVFFLRDDDVSRRAVYHTLEWVKDLPEPGKNRELLQKMLAYQLSRQSGGQGKMLDAAGLAGRLVALTLRQQPMDKQCEWLKNFLTVGEFLAREVRATPIGETA